jgi:hypothetical protein
MFCPDLRTEGIDKDFLPDLHLARRVRWCEGKTIGRGPMAEPHKEGSPMRQFTTLSAMAAVVMIVTFWSGAALADQPAAGPSKKAAAARLNSPRTTVGEVVDLVPGKSVQIKEETGALHHYGLTKTTKIDGDLKVGGTITVMSTGRWAREITVQPAKTDYAGSESKD